MTTSATIALDLAVLSGQVNRFVRRQHPVETSTTWRALAVLDEKGPMRLGEFAEADQLSQPAATAKMRRLADEGLVDRARDPEDGRAVVFTLTPAGQERLATLRHAPLTAIEPAVDALSDTERSTLVQGLDLIRRVLAESTAAATGPTHPEEITR